MRVIVTKGLPGSGKTTWAREQQQKEPGKYKVICKDDLRAMFDGGRWSKANEQFVVSVRNALILETLQAGYTPIIADTNLDPKHEQGIRDLLRFGITHQNVTVEIKDFTDVPLEECIKRDQKRPNYAGEKVIRDMWRRYLAPKTVPPASNPTLPAAIICDLDGTLALLNGRDPYNAATCEQDILNEPVAMMIRHIPETVNLILVSGRMDTYRPQTCRWLDKHGIKPHALYMRPTGDTRKDAIVKREIYEHEIADKFHVLMVWDDRDQVVQMWRSLGLPCFQVADGNF